MRYQDWPKRLSGMIETYRNTPFEWGTHDCCLFAANVVQELTGVDHAADLRGQYRTALEAARVLKDRGGVRGVTTKALGPEIKPTLAQRGDVVMIRDQGDTLAICISTHCAAVGERGLSLVPMSQAVTAWRVS